VDNRPKTLFIDIDGLLLRHYGSGNAQAGVVAPQVLPGVIKKLDEWDRKGYKFILVTGRRESEREATEKQLHSAGIVYDQLIMGIGGGKRIVINDFKPDSTRATAGFVCVERNEGLKDVYI
jgi:hydroxymethylpyrimidine pyrophosphatase-like HAD family hydrolase